MKKRKFSANDTLSAVLFFACLILLAVLAVKSIKQPDEEKSYIENRTLAQYEQPEKSAVLDGTWTADYESYCMDQFYLREETVKRYFGILDTLKVRERNGFVRGRDDALLTMTDLEDNDRSLSGFESYAMPRVRALETLGEACSEAGSRLIYLQIPHKVQFFADHYPAFYEYDINMVTARQKYLEALLEQRGTDVLDVAPVMKEHKDEYIYFYTDNHYTFLGAYYTYKALLGHINEKREAPLVFPEWDECELIRVNERFVGGYLRTFGDSGLLDPDYMEYVTPYDMPQFVRYEHGKESGLPVLSDASDYSRFMNGNYANTVIDTQRPELPEILYIGYSYTNPLEYLSIYSFDKMHSIDPRYYKESISEYVRNHGIDYVVVVKNDLYDGNPENTASI